MPGSRPAVRSALLSLVSSMALLLAASGGWAAERAEVRVDVGIDHRTFYDGIHRAAFAITCSDGVPPADCPSPAPSEDVDPAAGTVRKAMLGFDATRDSQLVDGTPLLTTEQADSVHVDLESAGDLTVTLTGRVAPGVDPMPVPGSASAGGEISGRSVVWHVAGAGPGDLDFSARFRPNHAGPVAGAYWPEATISVVKLADSVLEHSEGSVPAAAPVNRASTVTMRQRVAPPYGSPAMRATPFVGSPGGDGLPDVWEVSASLDAFGAYAGAAGAQQARSVGMFEDIAPGSGAANLGGNITTTWHAIGQEGKATPQTGAEIAGGKLAGLSYSLKVEGPRLGAPYGDQLWDGDFAGTSGVAGIYNYSKQRTGPPVNDNGRFEAVWDGALAQGWSALWADDLQGQFHDQGSHVVGANVTYAAIGGDVDNRAGTAARVGPPLVVRLPEHQRITYFLAVTSHLPETSFSADFKMDANRLTITPRVGAGGYWLESSGGGYLRDWTNNVWVMIVAEDIDAGFDYGPPAAEASLAGTTVIPAGMKGEIVLADGTRGVERSPMGSGVWRWERPPTGDLHIAMATAPRAPALIRAGHRQL